MAPLRKSRDYRQNQNERFTAAKREAARAREALRSVKVDQVEWREEWLAAAVDLLHPIFAERGYSLPDKLRVSLTRPERKKTGRCYPAEISAGGCTEVFVSAAFADSAQVLEKLAMELCRAAPECKFKRCARDMDLCGGGAPAWAEGILSKLGPFPHDAMELPTAATKQACRNLLRQCSACGAKWRAAGRWSETQKKLRCPDPDCEGILK